MNWEDSKSCTALKRDFLKAWFAEDRRFFLTGGSALGIFHLHHRTSYDLDLFSDIAVDPVELRSLVMDTSRAIGAKAESLQSGKFFNRYLLTRTDEREIIDLVIDLNPQLEMEKDEFGDIRVDTVREMTANKLGTLLSRAEIKDVIDLYFLAKEGQDILASIPDAMKKDGGWEPAVVAMLLQNVDLSQLPDLMIQNVDRKSLSSFVDQLRLELVNRSLK